MRLVTLLSTLIANTVSLAQGMKKNADGSTTKVFGSEEANVPLQMALFASPAPDPRFEEEGPTTLEKRFPTGKSVVLLGGKYKGCTGVVASVNAGEAETVNVKVTMIPPEPPFGLAIVRSTSEQFMR